MKSGISCFNWGVSKSLLCRSWPLWLCNLAALLFCLPVQLARGSRYITLLGADGLDHWLLDSIALLPPVAFAVAILAAMALFGYLYTPRGCGMMNALPLRRETLFLTAFLTGLGMQLLADLLVFALTALFFLGQLRFANLLLWLGAAAMSQLAFYGFAVFCAMLTGNLFILPAVYAVLSLAAWVVEGCVQNVLRVLIYGWKAQTYGGLLWLSPIMRLHYSLYASRVAETGAYTLYGLGYLGAYAGAGLVFAALALLLYRRRRMESATDTVAIPALKPIFQYCMAFGTALVLAAVVYSIVLGGTLDGRAAAVTVLVLMLLGAFLGFFAAEMLIQKTMKVFHRGWKGLAAVWGVLILLLAVAELDVTGYERRVPDPAEVRSATLSVIGGKETYDTPENLAALTAVHRQLVAHKALHESDLHGGGDWVDITYTLNDGRELERAYYLAVYDWDGQRDLTDIKLVQSLENRPEIILQRNRLRLPVTEATVYNCNLGVITWDESGREYYDGLNLTPAQAVDFYENALLPDMEEGTAGWVWLVQDESYEATASNVFFSLELYRPSPESPEPIFGDYLYLQLCANSRRCLAWIEANTDFTPMPLSEAAPNGLPAYG